MSDDPRVLPSNAARNREQHEPEELHTPIGWPLLLVFLGIISFGAVYYFRDLLSANGAPSDAGDRRSIVVIDPRAKADGAAVFSGNCAACHQATGLGLPGVFPPLAGSEWAMAKKDIPVQILLHGLSGTVTVKGSTFAGAMPSFAQLKDAEIAAVLSHVRKTWGNSAGEVTADDIAAGRKAFPDQTAAWSESELREKVGGP